MVSIDLSNNTQLIGLFCQSNQLSSLDITQLDSLETIEAHENEISHLDLSNNYNLKSINLNENKLTHLDMRNGITDQLNQFRVINNHLACVLTNDPEFFTSTINSLYLGFSSSIIATIIGTMAAIGLSKTNSRKSGIIDAELPGKDAW